MNAEIVNDLKIINRDYLMTPRGKADLKLAIQLKKQWIKSSFENDICINTAGVNLKLINKRLRKNIKKLKIIPIGLNNNCHSNSYLFSNKKEGFSSQLGFNITACFCGKLTGFEIHTVNRYKSELYDFTRDFNEEFEKYFMEFKSNIQANQYVMLYGNQILNINKGCICSIEWDNINLITEKELNDRIQFIENI